MTIKIVTDSTADLSAMLTEELDVTVVPVYLRFGDEVYRHRVNVIAKRLSRSGYRF